MLLCEANWTHTPVHTANAPASPRLCPCCSSRDIGDGRTGRESRARTIHFLRRLTECLLLCLDSPRFRQCEQVECASLSVDSPRSLQCEWGNRLCSTKSHSPASSVFAPLDSVSFFPGDQKIQQQQQNKKVFSPGKIEVQES